uniref:Uncharacterized protein n=1 Tax=Anguilla anguilla TaxID=7936 RepID=A0A0E9Q5G1_ANGAN
MCLFKDISHDIFFINLHPFSLGSQHCEHCFSSHNLYLTFLCLIYLVLKHGINR